MDQYNDEIQLKDILIKLSEYKALFFKKKITILAFAFSFFVIGIFYAFNSDIKYDAELTFVVEGDNENKLATMGGIASQLGIDLGGNQSSTFNQSNIIELLKSRGVIVRTLMQSAKVDRKTDLLIEHYIKIKGIKDKWVEDDFSGVSFNDNRTYIHDSISGTIWLAIIEDNLTVELEFDEANIITLSYNSVNQEFAKEFVEKLISEMGKMYVAHQTVQANNTLFFLQDRADSVFIELVAAEEKFAKVKDVNQRIVKASGRLKEVQLMRSIEVLSTMYLEIIKNLELSKITLLNKTPIINIIDKPILPLKGYKISMWLAGLLASILGGGLSLCYFIFMKLFKDALIED